MGSLIPGYEYDIFISYRQKDNKGDRWVSKFVEALKTELEATFKEDVSVYFDENPHDRLQETHNVDKSLEGKLKCLIFIPILSQTYCDPNSYAWQYEFLAFIKMLEDDRFGKDVRLRSGNVTSRILPARIHDLEPEDVKLFEKETGNVLRSLDFIFRTSTGVSRPLNASEDHPNDNLNKTFYGDQINKVGHAIKEIILGMKAEPVHVLKEKDQTKESFKKVREDEKSIDLKKPVISGKLKLLTTFAVLVVLIITGLLVYTNIFRRDKFKNLKDSEGRISIAVMPFKNMTNDTIWNVWQGCIQNELITSLTNYKELKVRQIESINSLLQNNKETTYASLTPSVASTLSQKLGAKVFIYGSIVQDGSILRINAQLIDSKTQESFKSFQIEGTSEKKILPIIDSLSALVKNFLLISVMEKEVPRYFHQIISTNSSDAYRYYMYGHHAFYKLDFSTAREWFLQAIGIDTNFVGAMAMISFAYGNEDMYEELKKWSLKAYRKIDIASTQQKLFINHVYAIAYETPNESIKYLKQLLELDDQSPMTYRNLGSRYNNLDQYEKAIPEFEKSLAIYNKWGSKPDWILNYTLLGEAYHKTGEYKKERELYNKAEQFFLDNSSLIRRQTILALAEADKVSANKYIQKYIAILKGESLSEAFITNSLASIYFEAGVLDKAEEYYRQALSLEPENTLWMNNLAYFMIDKVIKVNEGMELVDKALKLTPDNYNCLHTKGWGLYKLGKYKEALEILQKSWDIRREKAIYDHEAFLHLEEAKKAVSNQRIN